MVYNGLKIFYQHNVTIYIMEELKSKFFQKYANLPGGARDEIIVVLNDEEYTWRSAKVEIISNTKIGSDILNFLNKIRILE